MGETVENIVEENREIKVSVSPDDMEVAINVPIIYGSDNEPYIFSKREILEALSKKNIQFGIDKEQIDRIVEGTIYGRDVVVARGVASVDGVDAHFDFFFDTNLTHKPAIRADGTADYWSIHLVELTKKRQVVAQYYDAIAGKDGMTVKGKPIKCRRGRELAPMTGVGFSRIDGNHLYVSNVDGKIEYVNRRIMVLPVYEIYGDVCMKTGNVSFKGDVIIHGNVRTGMSIESTGTVTVDGVVEGASITADKNILVRGGIQGGKKAVIVSKAEISAGFIEYAYVEAEGSITADSILDSTVHSHDKITVVTGPNASIVGGEVYATSGIVARTIGNKHGVKTEITAGKPMELLQELFMLQSQIYDNQSLVDKIENTLKSVTESSEITPLTKEQQQTKMELLRAKVSKQAEIAKDNSKLEYIKKIMQKAEGATIRVEREIFQGCVITINSMRTTMEQHHDGVEFIETEKRLRMYSLAAMESGGVI